MAIKLASTQGYRASLVVQQLRARSLHRVKNYVKYSQQNSGRGSLGGSCERETVAPFSNLAHHILDAPLGGRQSLEQFTGDWHPDMGLVC